ncbi:hypothetical protein ABZ027_42580 [Streptomyces sp. NPDC006332]|uniref:hypothetical protein n=1 Tax=Streptomyces sp. NPDC006332 TaxID=3155456 RepID=UPI00339FFD1B
MKRITVTVEAHTMQTSDDTHTPTPLALLPLPALDGLSQEQVRGAACVWCSEGLDTGTAVDLGERRHKHLDGHYSTFPRACRRCAGEAAVRVVRDHAPYCELCVKNAAECDTGRVLVRLIREGGRA